VALRRPEPLADHHDLTPFGSGVASLDDWLRRRARANQVSGASRTFVLCDGETIIGYYALASGAVSAAEATGRLRRNMPDPIPVAILARLAVRSDRQGRGLGRALFRDAVFRVLNAAGAIGIRGLLVHAVSDEARAFYVGLGLVESPVDPLTLMASLGDLRDALD
jgi:GNAT superfamily N-acetyltransferase